MLKKKLVPTPLLIKKAHRIESGPALKPVKRFRLLFIFGLMFQVIWHQIMARIKGPKSEYTPLRLAIIVRTAMERLGGLWIKAAQIIAMRRDIFNREFCDEISKLHDRALGFPGETAKQIIEAEVGLPVDEIFDEFDVVPIAAASIGQVHIGYLRDNGKKVAIKVQRPGIAESFASDMTIVAMYINWLRLFRVMPWGRWHEMFQALQGTLADELDYRIEAASMRRMRKTLKPDKIHVPRVYTKYSKKRVLVMEFIDGVLMSDYIHAVTENPKLAKEWCKENDIKPKKLGSKLFLSFMMQLLNDNMVHGDLHPGNIMMLRKSKFCYIDYGSVGTLDGGFLQKYRMGIKAIARRDYGKYFDVLLTLIPGLPDVDIDAMRAEVVRELEGWEALTDVKGIPYEQRALTGANVRLSAILGKYQLPPLWGMLRIMRTGAALDASLRFLIPEVDFFKLTTQHFARPRQRMLMFMRSKYVRDDATEAVKDLMQLPAVAGEQLLFQADLIRKRAMSFQAQISKAAAIGRQLLTTTINVGLIAMVFVGARYLTKQNFIGGDTLAKLPVRDIFAHMPHLSPGMWIVVILLSAYLLQNLRKLVYMLGITGVGKNPFL
jgi:ubiquinone biosynthesis protein